VTSPDEGVPPGIVVVGLLFDFAGYVMVKHHQRLGQDNERRNIRWFGPRLGPRMDGAPWQVKQAGIAFIAFGFVTAGAGLASLLR
jgi:xanthosine utilization system XapX-like protein